MSDLFKTPLTPWHQNHKARMAPFAGWLMPIQYDSIIAEHQHTRKQAALFDICHMGEFRISGPQARQALSVLVTHNLETLRPGRCRYGFLLNPRGGIIDDLIVYCLGEQSYMLVVNAARIETDRSWIERHISGHADLEDISAHTGKIDLQGPQSLEVLSSVIHDFDWTTLPYFAFTRVELNGTRLLVSRTGYTGELGYEIYAPAEKTLEVWETLISDKRVVPAGLGARDTLRLEIGLPLYGQDLDEDHTPAEAGYQALLTSGADFVGKEGASAVRERLIALTLPGRRSARHGDQVIDANGDHVGRVTSGSFAPSLGHAVALAYVQAEASDHEQFLLQGPRTTLEAQQAKLPFYDRGTARQKLSG